MGLISRVSSRTYRLIVLYRLRPRILFPVTFIRNFQLNLKTQKKTPSNMANSELCCTYAALILHDSDVEINADNLNKVIKAAGVSVEPFWPGLFASALTGVDVAGLITNIGSGVGSGAPAAGGAAAAADAAPAEEAKKEESEEEESDSDMGFDLFG